MSGLWTGVSEEDLVKELSRIEDDGARAAVLDWIRTERVKLQLDVFLLSRALLERGASPADVLSVPETARGYEAAQRAVRGEGS